jgi:hypothetical protein
VYTPFSPIVQYEPARSTRATSDDGHDEVAD